MFIDSVEKLQKGDEILVPAGGSFRYYKLLETPRINPKTHRFSRVKCSTKMDIIQSPGWRAGTFHSIKVFSPVESDQHNHVISIDFRYRKMWLLRRIE